MQLAPPWVHLAGLPEWGEARLVEAVSAPSPDALSMPDAPQELRARPQSFLRFVGFLAQHEALQIHARLRAAAEPSGEAHSDALGAIIKADREHLQWLGAAALKLGGQAEGSIAFEVTARTVFYLEDPVPRLLATEVLAGGIYTDLLSYVLEKGRIAWLNSVLQRIADAETDHVRAAIERANRLVSDGVKAEEILQQIEPRASFLFAAAGADEEIKDSIAAAITGLPSVDRGDAAVLLKDVFTRIEKNKFRRLQDAGIPEASARSFVEAFSLVGPGIC